MEPSALIVDAGLVAGVVEISKRAGLPSAYGGVLALFLGIALGVLRIGITPNGLIYGVTVGLSASGVYEAAKNIGTTKPTEPTKERTTDAE